MQHVKELFVSENDIIQFKIMNTACTNTIDISERIYLNWMSYADIYFVIFK